MAEDERKKLIDEGLDLAKRVDTLRETKLVEEGNLTRFRVEAVQAVQTEIDAHVKVKDSLVSDIEVLKEKKRVLEIPLDDKWKEVNERSAQVLKDEQAVSEKSYILRKREEKVEKVEREVVIEKGRADDLTRRASEKLALADETLKDAQGDAIKVREQAAEVLQVVLLQSTLVKDKEEAVAVREQEVNKVWDRVVEKERDLAIREIQLKDKYQTLERTIKRMK